MKSGLVDNAPQPSNGLKPRHHHDPENGSGVDHNTNGDGGHGGTARCDDRPGAYAANNRDAIYRWQSVCRL